MRLYGWRLRIMLAIAVIGILSGPLNAQQRMRRGRSSDDFWSRRSVANGENEAAVQRAFQEALGAASAATVRVMASSDPEKPDNPRDQVALGAIVDPSGLIVTKASVLTGKIVCRFSDGQAKDATIVAQDEQNDLALLRVDASGLTAVSWREGDAPLPGSLVATTAPDRMPVSIGVVSTEVRRIPGPTHIVRSKAWLGIGLGGPSSGTIVESVAADSPAAKAGIHEGDEIQTIDGAEMKSAEQIVQNVSSHAPKQTIKLLVHRQEQNLELSATLAPPHPQSEPQDDWGGGPFSERRAGFAAVLPHDTPLRPRDCGGPLVDTDGRVVGINIARALRVSTYALPAGVVKQTIAELKQRATQQAKQ